MSVVPLYRTKKEAEKNLRSPVPVSVLKGYLAHKELAPPRRTTVGS